jgi:sec-independent protein translocase protein TatA
MNIGAPEVLLVLVLFLVFFGAKRLPDAARSIGQAFRTFKKEVRDVKEDLDVEDRNSDS